MATPLKPLGSPELNQDLPFQHRTWRIQRIGWGVIALVLLCAVLGLFGHGPLSRTTARDPSLSLSLDYERFGRYQNALTLRVHVHERATDQDTVRIWFSRDYLSQIEIQQIVPEPVGAETSPTGMIYVFRLAQPEQRSDVIVSVQMQAIGYVAGRIGLDESHALTFWQWIYP
ncbi:MAG: hypothetical protein M3Z35_05925 [Nitrospirota bacterium]|nr:hypothetical protein [Nitrospirota bacterium]